MCSAPLCDLPFQRRKKACLKKVGGEIAGKVREEAVDRVLSRSEKTKADE
jgi:hypothetical protein